MFYDIKREFVEFDEFDGYQKPSSKFKEILLYRVLFKFLEDNKTDKEKVEEILGKEIFDNFKKYKTCYGWIIQLITLKEKVLLPMKF